MKIRIVGSVGSGKTTLARWLSELSGTPFVELDQVVWERNKEGLEDRRRTEEERELVLSEILDRSSWIVEGVHSEEWTHSTFEKADAIVFLDPPRNVRKWRITKRFIKQRLKLEAVHYDPTWTIYKKMFKWDRYFEENGKPNVIRICGELQCCLITIKNQGDRKRLAKKLL
ncbi:AAA family ATPase [Jeotgalibacillus aurantiacus]|uniref:AAA family ATPase n=1 Tax=Jeotgalibacillus aurantiacus TaxID=2763266 RepID=UPI001D0B259A|nr:AAA family ATPase [Jeotgalibacillus aurantiacus]